MTRGGLGSRYEDVLDVVGRRIVDGTFPVGSVVRVEQIQSDLLVSRTVAREVMRTLATLGLVRPRQQVGTSVLPKTEWAVLHPRVIRWRALGPDSFVQQRELLEFRLGIEPVAAELSARRSPGTTAASLSRYADEMQQALEAQLPDTFFEADALFHSALLEGTGNAVLLLQAEVVAAVLKARAVSEGAQMRRLLSDSVTRHALLAQAVGEGDPDRARSGAEMIIRYTLEEFQPREGE